MMIFSVLAAAVISGQAAPPPIVQVPPRPPVLTAPPPIRPRPVSDQDRAIVDLMVPHDVFISGNVAAFVVSFDAANARDSTTQKLLAENPTLRATLLAAAEPEMVKILEADYPALREHLAEVFATGLSPGDYAPVMAYLRSSAAVKSRTASYGDSSRKLLAERSMANGNATLTKEDSAALSAKVARETLQALTPAEISAVAQFSSSPAGRRFLLAHQRVTSISLEWANGLATRSGPITEAMMTAAQKFFGNAK